MIKLDCFSFTKNNDFFIQLLEKNCYSMLSQLSVNFSHLSSTYSGYITLKVVYSC